MGKQQVVIIGETAIDVLVACGSSEPVWGQVEREVSDAQLVMGSSGAITAAALATLGLSVQYVGVVGDDYPGKFFRDELIRFGVGVDALRDVEGARTGITIALERDDDRAMLTFPGVMSTLTSADVPDTVLDSAVHLHVSSYFLQRGLHRGLAKLLARAKASGATTSLDPGWDSDGNWDAGLVEVLRHVDWFLPNQAEARAIAERLAGHEVLGDEGSLRALHGLVGNAVAIKRGATGAEVTSGGEILTLATDPLAPVDTTGAGDNFDAGFIFGMLEGNARSALALGVACGRHSILGRGGTGNLASRAAADTAARNLLECVTSRAMAGPPTRGAPLKPAAPTEER